MVRVVMGTFRIVLYMILNLLDIEWIVNGLTFIADININVGYS